MPWCIFLLNTSLEVEIPFQISWQVRGQAECVRLLASQNL